MSMKAWSIEAAAGVPPATGDVGATAGGTDRVTRHAGRWPAAHDERCECGLGVAAAVATGDRPIDTAASAIDGWTDRIIALDRGVMLRGV